MVSRRCVDCEREGITSRRKAPHAGPRCATHHRIKRREVKKRSHAAHVLATYNLTEDEYWGLYNYQGQRCWLCQRSKGLSRKLSVDHSHSSPYGEIRALLCLPCNRFLGHIRDDPESARRLADYLDSPPARGFFGGIRAITGEVIHE